MIKKWQWTSGRRVEFEWHPDPSGPGGLVSMLPGVSDFHADSEDDARDIILSLFDLRATE